MNDDNGMMRRADGGLVFDAEQRQILRDTYANGATDGEFAVLMEVATQRGLNPFKREIFFVKRWDSDKHREVWQPQVSVDGLRLIAQRTGLYDGQDEPEFVEDADGTPKLCKVRVYRKDWTRPAVGVAYWSEYVQTTRDKQTGKTRPNSMWSKMPHTMLAKCAESLAIRKAFTESAAGLYTDAEMGQADNDRPATKPVTVEQRRTPIDATPSPLQLPADNGRGPSSVSPANAPEDVAPVVVAPPLTVPLTANDLRAMLDELRGAATLDALRASIHAMADDAERGTDAHRSEIRAAFAARKAELALATTPPDEPPPDGPKGRRKAPAKTTDATGDATPAANDAQGAAASAWEPFATSDGTRVESEAQAREVLRGYPLPRIVRSARLHTPAWQALCDAEAAKRAAMPATRAA